MALYFSIILIISKIISINSGYYERSNYCSKCNPIAKLFVKYEKDIYTPVNKVGCEYSKKCELGKVISLNA